MDKNNLLFDYSRSSSCVVSDVLTKFDTYEDFLDSQITELDLFYIQDTEIARKLVECGFRGSSEGISRVEFEYRKNLFKKMKEKKKEFNENFVFDHIKYPKHHFLSELVERELPNRKGFLSTIIFLRDVNSKGIEVSSYIDYAHRLEIDDFMSIFKGNKKLKSKITDLSYYNWSTNVVHSNESSNYTIIADNINGLIFKNKKSRVLINISQLNSKSDLFQRTEVSSNEYLQIVLFDHVIKV